MGHAADLARFGFLPWAGCTGTVLCRDCGSLVAESYARRHWQEHNATREQRIREAKRLTRALDVE